MRSSAVYIGIGSNFGNRKANIEKAIRLLCLTKGLKFDGASSIYETEPVGGPPQNKFLNGALRVKTNLGPFRLLTELKKIEKRLGRKRGVKNGPRTIDLDILLYGNKKVNTRILKVPHPRMHKREFVLRGLRELK